MILRISRTLNRYAVEILTLPVNQCYSLNILFLKDCWGLHSYRRAAKKGCQIFGIHLVYRETFLQIHRLPLLLLILKNWIHGGKSLKNRFICLQRRRVKDQKQTQDLRCQSGPSAKDSVIFSGGDSSKKFGADQQRLQISDLHFDKFPTPATFACWKIRFKTEVCTCSEIPTEAMQWIKEAELVDSADELRSSSSKSGISMPNFEVLDARIASALNKIIHNSQFKRRISLEEQKAQKEGPFPSR